MYDRIDPTYRHSHKGWVKNRCACDDCCIDMSLIGIDSAFIKDDSERILAIMWHWY